DATLHEPAHVEVVGVEERRDRDAKNVGWRQVLRDGSREKLAGNFLDRLLAGLPILRGAQTKQRNKLTAWHQFLFAAALAAGATAELAQVLLHELPRARPREGDAIGENVEMISGIDETGQRRDLAAGAIRIGEAMTIRMSAGQGHEVVFTE